MQKIAVFPGSFDPFTVGHENIVLRALDLFDQIIVAIGIHSTKTPLLKIQARVDIVNKVFRSIDKVHADSFEGLTVDYCRKVNATHMLRGIRTAADFEYEREMALMNNKLSPDIEIVCLMASLKYQYLSSSRLKEVAGFGGDIYDLVPEPVANVMKKKYFNH